MKKTWAFLAAFSASFLAFLRAFLDGPFSPSALHAMALGSASSSASDADKRSKRNRTFIDPVSEVPRLEEWFVVNTHPSHAMIARYIYNGNL